jgi:hypothetical protein
MARPATVAFEISEDEQQFAETIQDIHEKLEDCNQISNSCKNLKDISNALLCDPVTNVCDNRSMLKRVVSSILRGISVEFDPWDRLKGRLGLNYILAEKGIRCQLNRPEQRRKLIGTIIHLKGLGTRRIILHKIKKVLKTQLCEGQEECSVERFLDKIIVRLHKRDIDYRMANAILDLLCSVTEENKNPKKMVRLATDLLDRLM